MDLIALIDKNTATRSNKKAYAYLDGLHALHDYDTALAVQEQLLFMDFDDQKVSMDYAESQIKMMSNLKKKFRKIAMPIETINNASSFDTAMNHSFGLFTTIYNLMSKKFSDNAAIYDYITTAVPYQMINKDDTLYKSLWHEIKPFIQNKNKDVLIGQRK